MCNIHTTCMYVLKLQNLSHCNFQLLWLWYVPAMCDDNLIRKFPYHGIDLSVTIVIRFFVCKRDVVSALKAKAQLVAEDRVVVARLCCHLALDRWSGWAEARASVRSNEQPPPHLLSLSPKHSLIFLTHLLSAFDASQKLLSGCLVNPILF